jgi:hypothetical protein
MRGTTGAGVESVSSSLALALGSPLTGAKRRRARAEPELWWPRRKYAGPPIAVSVCLPFVTVA